MMGLGSNACLTVIIDDQEDYQWCFFSYYQVLNFKAVWSYA